jgi:hypothetical protein
MAPFAVGGVAVLARYPASGPAGEASGIERPLFRRWPGTPTLRYSTHDVLGTRLKA